MYNDYQLITRAQEVLREIAKGINPIDGTQIEQGNFVKHDKIVKCFNYSANMLDKALDYIKNNVFYITPQQKERISVYQDKVGVMSFARAVNEQIDKNVSMLANGKTINKNLKRLGVLGEKTTAKGGKVTILIPASTQYGFESIRRESNGRNYDQIVANRKGQKYLIDNLEELMK
jgi:hypothetical protein